MKFPKSQSKLIAEKKHQCAFHLVRLNGWSSCSHPGPCGKGCILKMVEQKDGRGLGHGQIQGAAMTMLNDRPSDF